MKEEVRRHVVVLVVYFAVVAVFRVFALGFGDVGSLGLQIVGLWLGGVIGYLLVLLDRLVYVYLLRPHEQLSQQVQFMLAKRNIRGVLELVHRRRREQTRLAFRSFLFMVAWVFLALFALTSTAGTYGGALVMGLGLHLVYDLWRDQQMDPKGLNQKLFWQVKRAVPMRVQKVFLYLFSGVFVLLTFLLI